MGQPVLTVLRHVLAGPYEGLILDHASAPARAVFPRALLEKLLEKFDETLTVKTLLAEERTAGDRRRRRRGARARPVLGRRRASGEGDRPGIAEARGAGRLAASRGLLASARGRGDGPGRSAPRRSPAHSSAVALRGDEELTGVIVDPRGPWIRLSRDDLAPVIALAG